MLPTPLFLSTIFGSGNCLQKSQFFNKARSAFSHFLIRDCAALQSKNHFCGKMFYLPTFLSAMKNSGK